jgi:hypothetical protein
MMFRIMLAAGLAALTVVATPIAGAQTVGAEISFTPAERTALYNWIYRQRPAPVKDVSVGAMLPSDVETYPVPQDWGRSVTRYRYVHVGKTVYFVDPKSGRVVFKVD